MNDLTPIQPPTHSASSSEAALIVELAKVLKLVAPVTMNAEAQAVWLRAAADALEGIRALEVAEISTELRRKVTRHTQIVHEIAELVDALRKRRNRCAEPKSPYFAAYEIEREASFRRGKARTAMEIEEVWDWERNARIDAGLAVPPVAKPFTESELRKMPAHIVQMGIKSGFLKRVGDRLVEVTDVRETEQIRELNRSTHG